MERQHFREYGFLIASLILLAISFATLYRNRGELLRLQEKILLCESTMVYLNEASTHLLQMEASSRGFKLTENPWFMDTYHQSKNLFVEEMTRLDSLNEQNDTWDREMQQIDSLGRARAHHLDSGLQVYLEFGMGVALEYVRAGDGKDLMDAYRARSTNLVSDIRLQVNKDRRSLEQITKANNLMIISLGLVASLLLVFSYAYSIRSQRRAKAFVQALQLKNEELRQFNYGVSHDLREPLRMVTNFMDLLQKRYGQQLDETAHTYINYAVDGGRRMQLMINDLLEYSRTGQEGAKKEKVDLNEVWKEAKTNLLKQIEECQAIIIEEGTLPTLMGCRSELLSLFQNLLSNALKFQKRGQVPEVVIRSVQERGNWVVSIQDNGIGISPDDQKRIFNIFTRLHSSSEFPGTGIGLALCHKIVRHHQGTLQVSSAPGQGSTFTFSLKGEPPKNKLPVSSY